MREQEIVAVLSEMHRITGFRMSLHDVNFNEMLAYPEEKLPICNAIQKNGGETEKCMMCDKIAFSEAKRTQNTIIYKCRYGLTEAVCPLYNFGTLTGYLMMGQTYDDTTDMDKFKALISELDNAKTEILPCIDSVTAVPGELVNSYCRIMTICAQYLTLSNAMPSGKPSFAESAKKYIYENLDKRITIHDICREIGCSKTTLISSFKKEFGTTVNAAITEAKLNEAKRLLRINKMSISEIASATGFYDQAYFSKVFSAKFGISPSEYRKA